MTNYRRSLTAHLTLLLLGLAHTSYLIPHTFAQAAPTCRVTVTVTNAWVCANRPALLYTVIANNTSSSNLYLFCVATNSTPGNGALPALPPLLIPTTSTGGYDFQNIGFTFTGGLTFCASSTAESLTLGSASFIISANYQPK